MERKDIRFLRTEQKLIDVMLELLTCQSFDQITINQICSAASISRTAFYRHFEDKYRLALRCVYEIFTVIPRGAHEAYSSAHITSILEASRKYHKALQNLRKLSCNQELHHRIDNMFFTLAYEYYKTKEAEGVSLPLPLNITVIYHCSGLIRLFDWWFFNDCDIPVHTMLDYIMQLNDRSIGPQL